MTTAPPPSAALDERFRGLGCELRLAVVPEAGMVPPTVPAQVRQLIAAADRTLSRFDRTSELRLFERGSGAAIPVSRLLALAVEHARSAALLTGGLLDPTLTTQLEDAGYADDWDAARRVPLRELLALAPARRPAQPSPVGAWRGIYASPAGGTLRVPEGVRLDVGATAKGLIADLALRLVGPADLAIVDLGGDLAINGAQLEHGSTPVLAADPFGGAHVALALHGPGGVATSSIAGRCWLSDGGPAHHLLDPSTGRPAFTGLVQVTAAAPSAAHAEVIAGHALLAGPAAAPALLTRHGGVLVADDGTTTVIAGDLLRPGVPS